MKKREYPRIEVAHLQADVSDGKGFFNGSVKNISRFGLAISNLPFDLDDTSDLYSVIIDGPGTHFKLLVRPVWETNHGICKTIGTRIENSPWTWTEFVLRQETLSDQLLTEQNAD